MKTIGSPFTSPVDRLAHEMLDGFAFELAAADKLAVGIIVTEGLRKGVYGDSEYFWRAIGLLADVAGPFPSPPDDMISMAEHDAKSRAAYMLGLAIGLRLRGVNIGLTEGGAR